MKKIIKISLFISLVTINMIAAQSPWTKEKGKAFVQLGFSGIFYNKAEINGKTTNLNADYSDITIQAYSEYGISNKLEAKLIVPFKSVIYTIINGNSNSYSALGNVTLGLKYKIYDKSWKISSGILVSPKTSQYDTKSGLSSGFNATNVLPYISVGSSKGKWYYFANLGYGYMSNNYSDYVKLAAELGYKAIPKGYIMLALDTRNTVNKENAFTNDAKQWISYSDRQTFEAVGLKLNYEFLQDKMGVNFSVFGAFGNNNAPLAPSLNLGLYAKL